MAFACRPRVIVLDEPTTGLDVTTQAHVLDTVRELAALHGTAALYVSHDLAVVGTLAARVAVMYAGRIVELGSAEELFRSAAHPYTRRLVAAIPHLSGRRALVGIPGRAPSPGNRPAGCFFAPRCAFVQPACETALPDLRMIGDAHAVRCVRAEEVRVQARAGVGARRRPRRCRRRRAGARPSRRPRRLRRSDGRPRRNLELSPRECLALVGESGLGQDHARALDRGPAPASGTGEILLRGTPLAASSRGRPREARRDIQYIFQNPYGSLNPRRTIGQIVRQPLEPLRRRRRMPDAQVDEMLERVAAQRRIRRPLSRPALRRRAAAGRDRPGAGLRSRPCWSATRSPRRST